MTDDPWRRRGEDDDFGPPLFADDRETGRSSGLSFSDADPLPHWTAPATGELPQVFNSGAQDPTDDVDVWSSFSGETPAWSDEPTRPEPSRRAAHVPPDRAVIATAACSSTSATGPR